MSVVAVTMVKSEEDIVYHSLINLAEEGVDAIIIADNLSEDNTLEEIKKAQKVLHGSCEIVILNDPEIGYYQSEKMTDLAHKAHKTFGAEWIIPFDADEILFSHEGKVADVLRDLPKDVSIAEATLYNHFPTALDVDSLIPFQSLVWRLNEKGALPKVAVRYHKDMIIHQGNHSAFVPGHKKSVNCLEIRHFPYRTWEQFKRKVVNGAKAYAATNLPPEIGSHWKGYNQLLNTWGDDVVEQEVFRKFFYFFSPMDKNMIYDPAPFRRWAQK